MEAPSLGDPRRGSENYQIRAITADTASRLGAYFSVAPETWLYPQSDYDLRVDLRTAGLFARNEFARVSQICDIYEDQLAAAGKQFSGARTFRKIEELLASDVDAVLIATPPVLHPEHFEMAVRARRGPAQADHGGLPAARINWFMGKHPVKAFGYGGRAVRKNIGNIMDNLAATFIFDDGTVFSYSANQFSAGGFQDVSETFLCEKGSITVSRQGYKLYNKDRRGAPPSRPSTAR